VHFPHKDRIKILLAHTSFSEASRSSELWSKIDMSAHNYGVDDVGVTAALDAADAVSGKITHLDLSRCIHVTNESLSSISSRCKLLKHIEVDGTLAFRQANITDEGMASILSSCHHLETVSLRRTTKITDATLVQLTQAPCQPCLTSLDFLGNVRITDDGISALSACGALRHLNLSACRTITSSGIMGLLEPGTIALESLRLDGCHRVGDAAMPSIATLIGTLSVLSLAGCQAITDSGLQTLVSDNTAGSSVLVELSVNFCRLLTLDGLEPLVKATHNTLVSLSLQKLPRLKAADTVRLLSYVPRLQVLHKGMLNDRGVAAVARACPELKELGLNAVGKENGSITDHGLAELANLTNLHVLNIAGLHKCTALVFEVVQKLRQLERLDMRGCDGVASTDMQAFLTALHGVETVPNLKHLAISMRSLVRDWQGVRYCKRGLNFDLCEEEFRCLPPEEQATFERIAHSPLPSCITVADLTKQEQELIDVRVGLDIVVEPGTITIVNTTELPIPFVALT